MFRNEHASNQNTLMKTDLFYMLSFKVIPIGFYTFLQRFDNCFIPFCQKVFGWVRTHSWTREITALLSSNRTPSKSLLSLPNKKITWSYIWTVRWWGRGSHFSFPMVSVVFLAEWGLELSWRKKIRFPPVFLLDHGRLARWRKWKSCDVEEAK